MNRYHYLAISLTAFALLVGRMSAEEPTPIDHRPWVRDLDPAFTPKHMRAYNDQGQLVEWDGKEWVTSP